MSKLTVVIITFNEEANIGRCLDSVQGITDEIVVVDSFSTDRTKEIAIAKGAKVIERAFANYIDQKNFVSTQAGNDFVLNLDADECLSPELYNSIKSVLATGFTADAYSMNRLNFYCGKPIKTCGWYPDKKIRLWNRNKARWTGVLAHEKMSVDKGVQVIHLDGDLLHYSLPTQASLGKKNEYFARLSARQLSDKNKAYLLFKMLFSPPFKFVKNYVFNLGFTEGTIGLTICKSQAYEVFLKYYLALKGGGV